MRRKLEEQGVQSDRALDGLGGACLGDCAHLEDQEEETERMEDLKVEITV